MDILSNLAFGFGVAFSLQNSLTASSAFVLGTLIGVLPGIGPLVAIGMLFPAYLHAGRRLRRSSCSRDLLRAQYGRLDHFDPRQPSGETASAVTCLDGYQMARQGRAGPALAVAALASFFAVASGRC